MLAALPLADASVLAAIAMHLLYLVPDPARAVAELGRVVRPGGWIVIGTSADDDKQLVWELLEEALTGLVPAPVIAGLHVHRRFDLNAAVRVVRAITPEVVVHDLRSEIRLATADPLIAYIDSLGWLGTAMLGADQWSRAIARVGSAAHGLLAAVGAIRIPTHTGVVVGRVPAHARPRGAVRRGPELRWRPRRHHVQPAGPTRRRHVRARSTA